ncbi:unnamed protein product [Owenia fusiformis]|uniref:Uncharacterized protein n=1 Tax=Owenia fusiformis TaxID=6347 RepID=A0A8J1U5R1_OWEFU|nr:unnamed protein product [Owenia fusiformis]
MPTYKLTYFNGRGFGEITRMIFKQAGVEFEDVRLERDEWTKMKEKGGTPFGQLPILEVDGKVLSQSLAIARFAARETGLQGKTSFDQAIAESAVEAVSEVFRAQITAHFEKDEAKKAVLQEKFNTETRPAFHSNMSKLIAGDWIVGNSVTWADLLLLNYFDALPEEIKNEIRKSYPKFAKVVDNVAALPNIAKWVKERPVTEF